MTKIIAFLKNESGATAIEYDLIAAGISIAIIAAVFAVGTSLNETFTTVSTDLQQGPPRLNKTEKPPQLAASLFSSIAKTPLISQSLSITRAHKLNLATS